MHISPSAVNKWSLCLVEIEFLLRAEEGPSAVEITQLTVRYFIYSIFIFLIYRKSALCVAIFCVCGTKTGRFSSLGKFLADMKVGKLKTYHRPLAFLPHGMNDVPVFNSEKKVINDFIKTKTAFSLNLITTSSRNSFVLPL
jgi:hypothetical protein